MMFRSAAAATLLLASSALAFEFTNPVSGSVWGLSQEETITWSAPGASDPANVSLLIANLDDFSLLPYYGTPLALNIPTSQGEYSLSSISIPKGEGYAILMVDINNSSNIYLQGGKFTVTESTATDKKGFGFSLASSTTILAGQAAGGPQTATPNRLVRHKRTAGVAAAN